MADKKSREVSFNNINKRIRQRERIKDVVEFIKIHALRLNLMNIDEMQISTIISVFQEWTSKNEPTIKIKADVNDTITGLKAVQREARNTSKALRELESQQRKNKHLVIEVDKLGDVPKVYHKGNEISKKESIRFEWDTANGRYQSRTKIGIDYYEVDDKGLVKKGIHELKGPRENEVCSVCGRDVQTRTLKTDCGEVFTEKVCTKCGSDIND